MTEREFMRLDAAERDFVAARGMQDLSVNEVRALFFNQYQQRPVPFAEPLRQRFPLLDAAHVRAALSRFGLTHFTSPDQKRVAAFRIWRAAIKFGIYTSTFAQPVPMAEIAAEAQVAWDRDSSLAGAALVRFWWVSSAGLAAECERGDFLVYDPPQPRYLPALPADYVDDDIGRWIDADLWLPGER